MIPDNLIALIALSQIQAYRKHKVFGAMCLILVKLGIVDYDEQCEIINQLRGGV